MNPRLQKTKQSLQDALIRLLEEKTLESVTVSELCTAAGINRTTFYKYYTVPADVLTEVVVGIGEQVNYSKDSPKDSMYDYMLACCRVFYEHKDLMMLYARNQGNLTPMIYRLVTRHFEDLQFLLNPTNNFIAGGVASVLAAWMLRGYPTSPEEMAQILADHADILMNSPLWKINSEKNQEIQEVTQ